MNKRIKDVICGFLFILMTISFIPFCLVIRAYACEQEEETVVPEKWTEFNNGNPCKITYYCLCPKCCGKWYKYNITKSGETPQRYVTVANGSLPFGTRVYIEGLGYRLVQDRGSKVTSTQFDVYVGVDNHEYAKSLSTKKRKVWIVE